MRSLGALSYARHVAGVEVWYDILVPYQINFETDPPADAQTSWASVRYLNPWGGCSREVTAPATTVLIRELGYLNA